MSGQKGGCALCGEPASKQCSSCKQAWYCSVECQRKHWKSGHKEICKATVARQSKAAATAVPGDTSGGSAPGPAHTAANTVSPQSVRTPAPPPAAGAATAQAIHALLEKGQKHAQASEFAEAVVMYRDAREKSIASFGVDSPAAFQSGDMLGSVLVLMWKNDLAQGCGLNEVNEHLDNALELYADLLTAKRAKCGADTQPVLMACEVLAQLQFNASLMVEACITYDELLKGCRRAMGPKHPTCLGIALNYALALANTQRFKKAIAVGKENLTISREVLGPTAIETLKVACNLTDAFAQQGDDAAASSLGSQTFDQCEKSLGAEHPLTKLMAHRADKADEFVDNTTSLTTEDLDLMWSKTSTEDTLLDKVHNLATGDACNIM